MEALAHGVEMIQSLLELEIGEVVGDQLVAQKGGELFVLFEEGVFEVGAEDMMTVLDAVDDGGELATHSAVEAGDADLRKHFRGVGPQRHVLALVRTPMGGGEAARVG